MQEVPILKKPEVSTNRATSALLSLDRLRFLTEGNPEELKELVNKAIEGLKEAKAGVQQACVDNNTILFGAAIHKVTPLFHYLDAQPLLAVIKACSETILKSNFINETTVDYQIIIRNLDNALAELSEKGRDL